MTDIEFDIIWQPFHTRWINIVRDIAGSNESLHFTDNWKQYIIEHIHELPIECIDRMSHDEPKVAGWSQEVVEAAKRYMAETFLLKNDEHTV